MFESLAANTYRIGMYEKTIRAFAGPPYFWRHEPLVCFGILPLLLSEAFEYGHLSEVVVTEVPPACDGEMSDLATARRIRCAAKETSFHYAKC